MQKQIHITCACLLDFLSREVIIFSTHIGINYEYEVEGNYFLYGTNSPV